MENIDSKVTVHISGKAMESSEGYELKYLINSLQHFERLSEKTYLFLVNQDRLTKQDSENFGVYISGFRHGSFKADILVKLETYVLPLLPVIAENKEVIWKCITNSFKFFKTISDARQKGEKVHIETVGDNSNVTIGNNNTVIVFPNYTPELTQKLSKEFVEIAKTVDGKVESLSFSNSSDTKMTIDETNSNLFKEKVYLTLDEEIVTGSVTVLNTHNNTGKIYISKGSIPEGEYKFDVQKEIRYHEYLASAIRTDNEYSCYVKMKFDPVKMEDEIVGIRIIKKL